ncbi:hypothetical protein K493DRAFT_303151 [Basidiobolus meristosporus CBS 931.73]|uniref:Uncharacterized protein n=1 Tax=Basidiobolus meristosporus CBS 931.73 TaxID=1314790 RepID=A0A1Y1Y406_9FUNG|nr:hypothetical protein K493DRAFT_303151 [Basidiobolus meristosporus CBS 931.73]|eukprot:ORX92737.1 hypothetical protein K493DRAFT_303151 [Basidiobolus meristosporus CBS 931.73]
MNTNHARKLSVDYQGEFWVPMRRGSVQLCDTTTVVAADRSLGKRNSLVATMLRLTPEDEELTNRKRPESSYVSFPQLEDEEEPEAGKEQEGHPAKYPVHLQSRRASIAGAVSYIFSTDQWVQKTATAI